MKCVLIGKDRWVNLNQMGYAYYDQPGSLCLNMGGYTCVVEKEFVESVLKAIKGSM